MKCPKCKVELVYLAAIINDNKEMIYLHPPHPFEKCEYEQDGVEVTVEVVDPFLCQKFNEMVKATIEQEKRWWKRLWRRKD